jgi:hypothetical protein
MLPVLHRALLLAAVFALSPLDGVAGEKQIVDVKELARSWRGWVNEVPGDDLGPRAFPKTKARPFSG